MGTPQEVWNKLNSHVKKQWKIAFLAAFILGFFIHLPMLVSDIPNHDGLDSMYFDQNMITSGRWFLGIACGLTSYYSLPWLCGLVGLLFLAVAAAALTEFLRLDNPVTITVIAGLLVAFPAIASNFAYVYTMDGYMLALLLAIAACLFTRKYKYGFVGGGICLAFSLGIYQAYLPFAMLLSIYAIWELLMSEGAWKEKIRQGARYLFMGIIGVAAYYLILQVLLLVQGVELSGYQGIGGGGYEGGLLQLIYQLYRDFLAFSINGNVLMNNVFSVGSMCVLLAAILILAFTYFINIKTQKGKGWKKLGFLAIIGVLLVVLPVAANIMLVISPGVNYHSLMRYQWVLFAILPIAYIDRYGREGRMAGLLQWMAFLAGAVLLLNFAVTDNIAYSNLHKKYEKTYAYCVRLLDRIENTEGYYQGIPIAMIGVVSDEQYPATDITQEVTAQLVGIGGDSLLYTSTNYELFMKYYLGATLNFVPVAQMGEIYYTEEYVELESFPGENSIKIVDGIMYIKTENTVRKE